MIHLYTLNNMFQKGGPKLLFNQQLQGVHQKLCFFPNTLEDILDSGPVSNDVPLGASVYKSDRQMAVTDLENSHHVKVKTQYSIEHPVSISDEQSSNGHFGTPHV